MIQNIVQLLLNSNGHVTTFGVALGLAVVVAMFVTAATLVASKSH